MTSESDIKLKLARLDDPEFSQYENLPAEAEANFGPCCAKAWILNGSRWGASPAPHDSVPPLLLENHLGNFLYIVYKGNRFYMPAAGFLSIKSGFLKDFTKEEIWAALAEIKDSCERHS